MKKTRFLALTLVAVIMLTGAGYAWWTDTLVVNTKVDTGYLDVDFTKVETPKKFLGLGYSDPQDVTINVSGPKALNDEGENGDDLDLIEFDLIDFYPGAKVRRYITLKNVGTLEAKIKRSDVVFKEINVDPELKNYMKVKANSFALLYPYSEEEGATLETAIEPEFKEFGLLDINLKKGESCIIEVEFELDGKAPNNTEVKKASYAMTLNVKQFNE